MRIDNASKLGYDRNMGQVKPGAKSDSNAGSASSLSASEAGDGQSRAERIASLKQQFASGKPIDVQKLASTLVQSGVLFDENA